MGKHKVKSSRPNKKAGEKALLRAKAKKKLKSKVREKGTAKPARKLSVPELLHKVEECLDAFQYEEALQVCDQALALEPRSVPVLDVAGPLLLELGHTDRAIECFKTAVELSPGEGHSKYMYLGQLSSGEEAVGYLTTGIGIMAATLQRPGQTEVEGACASVVVEEEEGGVTAEDLCTAYCSLAEVYLTDACFAADAEQRCFECCCKAVEYGPSSPEAHQLLASCLLSQDKQEEARSVLLKSVSLWLSPSLESGPQEEGGWQVDPDTGEGQPSAPEAPPPPYFTRVNCAKLLLELSEHERCRRVLEGLLCEDDEVVVVWYLMGWLHRCMDDRDSARFFLQQTEKLFLALGCDDTDLLEHTRALLQEMGPEETGGGVEEGEEGEKEEIGEGEEGEDETQCSSEHGEHQDSMDAT